MVPPGQRSVSYRRPAGAASVLHRRRDGPTWMARPRWHSQAGIDGIDGPPSRPSDRMTRQPCQKTYGGILSSSHAPYGADDAREVNGVDGNGTRNGRGRI